MGVIFGVFGKVKINAKTMMLVGLTSHSESQKSLLVPCHQQNNSWVPNFGNNLKIRYQSYNYHYKLTPIHVLTTPRVYQYLVPII